MVPDELGALRRFIRRLKLRWVRPQGEEDKRNFVKATIAYIWGIRK